MVEIFQCEKQQVLMSWIIHGFMWNISKVQKLNIICHWFLHFLVKCEAHNADLIGNNTECGSTIDQLL